MDYEEVMDYLGIAKCTVTRMLRRGQLKKIKLNGDRRIFIPLRSLLEFKKKDVDVARLAMRVASLESRIDALEEELRGKNGASKPLPNIDALIQSIHGG